MEIRGRSSKQMINDLKDDRGYLKLKEKTLVSSP
jgi:hypothetical protein